MKKKCLKSAIFEEWLKAEKEYYMFGDDYGIKKFSKNYPTEYSTYRKMSLKRIAIKDTIEPIFVLDLPLYWITLTFNNKKDKNSELYKLKETKSFLNEISPLWLVIEEYGEDNKRYHIHGFICPKMNISREKFFSKFRNWHSRQKIIELKNVNSGLKRVKYLSKYIVKQVPHLRRSRDMSKLFNFYKSIKKLRKNFPSLLEDRLNYYFDDNLLDKFYFK